MSYASSIVAETPFLAASRRSLQSWIDDEGDDPFKPPMSGDMTNRERNRRSSAPMGCHGLFRVAAVADHTRHARLLGRVFPGRTRGEARASMKSWHGPVPPGTVLEPVRAAA